MPRSVLRWQSRRRLRLRADDRRVTGPVDQLLPGGSAALPDADGDGHRAEGARRQAEDPGQRHRGLPVHDRECRDPHRQRGGDFRAEYLLHRVDGEEAEQRPFPWHQLQPEQSRHHDLYRWRPAVQREHLEHRAARCRSDRVRARSAERPLRTEHAGRAGEHHQHSAVAGEVDRHATGL